MAGRRARTRAGTRGASPVLALPPDTDRKTKAKLSRIIDIELAKAEGREPRVPRPFRFRFHLVPFCWLAAALAGIAFRGHGSPWLTGLAGLIGTAATVAATRERPGLARPYNQGMAAWSSAWAQIFWWCGSSWWTALWLAGWGVPSAIWVHRHRWRPRPPEPKPDTSVADTWRALCEAQNWNADLGDEVPLDGGGAQWPIQCDGIKTHIGMITPRRREIAAAFRKSITSCYAEPDTLADDESRGMLTILPRGSLDDARPWDGCGVDPATGLVTLGRYPDGTPVRERIFLPGVGGGIRHTIIAGCPGSGKTAMLDMGLCISAASPMIAPVILDPQMGQALPAWQDRVPYACGVEECMTFLRGLHAAMNDRSAHLASLTWMAHRCASKDGTDCTARCRRRKGFGFFDYAMIAAARAEIGLPPLPIIEITIDEAAVLLAMRGAPALLLDIAKLGRKVGFRLRLALQVPSISEMGKGELRSMFVGDNVFCFRTGDKVSNGMANIPANPHELPKFFRNGQPTAGLGFASTATADPRPSVTMRADYVPLDDLYDFAEEAAITGPDEAVADRLAATVAVAAEALNGVAQGEASLKLAKAGVVKILAGQPLTAGQVISATTDPVSVVSEALEALEDEGKIVKSGDGLLSLAEA